MTSYRIWHLNRKLSLLWVRESDLNGCMIKRKQQSLFVSNHEQQNKIFYVVEFVFSMVFDLLVKFHGSPHVSSVNLMTCMGSLTLIAKMRPQFMGKVIAALETLHSK
jgi:hypothetical protein